MLDAHCHFWQLDRGDYGWLAGTGGPLTPLRRDFLPQDYPGTGRMIAVQAAPTPAETDWLLALAKANPRIAGVVGWVDLADPGAADALARRAEEPLFLGMRPMLQDIEDSLWLLQAARPDALAALVAHHLCFDALVQPRHLPMLAHFVRQYPDLALVIDHAAKPQSGDLSGWLADLRQVARAGPVYCKLSGLLTELPPEAQAAPLQALRRIVEPLLEIFGPERLIWGSDWPVLGLASDYAAWQALTESLLSALSASERAAIMGGNAARFYRVMP